MKYTLSGYLMTVVVAVFFILTLASCAISQTTATGNDFADSAVKKMQQKQPQQISKRQAANSALTLTAHQQLVVVINDNWQADHGLLYRFEKIAGQWQQVSSKIQVSLGRTGLAWGIGLHDKQQGQVKKEGDGKAPAGIFALGDAFGYLSKLNTGLTYNQMSGNDFCIDVNGSPYYNQIVSKLNVGEQGIKGSSEPMRRDIHLNGDDKYKKAAVINHNSQNISAAGSCIFMHIWQDVKTATAGCTAMSETNITELLAWLDATKQPLYVALPKSEYLAKRSVWALPPLQ